MSGHCIEYFHSWKAYLHLVDLPSQRSRCFLTHWALPMLSFLIYTIRCPWDVEDQKYFAKPFSCNLPKPTNGIVLSVALLRPKVWPERRSPCRVWYWFVEGMLYFSTQVQVKTLDERDPVKCFLRRRRSGLLIMNWRANMLWLSLWSFAELRLSTLTLAFGCRLYFGYTHRPKRLLFLKKVENHLIELCLSFLPAKTNHHLKDDHKSV